MKPLTHASLFSGIGGFDLAAELAGWTNLFNCEKDPFCQRVLKYHFPDAIQYSDIRDTDFTIWRGRIDILTGGFPCQPFSHAGKRKGAKDDRYLWPEMLRAISEIRPAWVIGENVGGIVSMVQPGSEIEVDAQATLLGENYTETETVQEFVVETICQDLERIGYSVQPVLIPACGVGAPHRRDRVWFIAFMENAGSVGRYGQGVLHQQPGGASIIGTGEVGLSGVRKELEDAAFELAKDPQRVRRDSVESKEESGAGGFGESGAGDHVRVCGETGTATHPDSERQQEFQHPAKPGLQGQSGRGIPERDVTHAHCISRNSRRSEATGQFGQAWTADGRNVDAADASRFGWKQGRAEGDGIVQDKKVGADLHVSAQRLSSEQSSANASNGRLPHGNAEPGGQQAHPTTKRQGGIPDWHDFPTQPPIRGGDDGLPAGLDGITFPKWRSESIKAYGNAIVPQVAYQIFKAINECEQL